MLAGDYSRQAAITPTDEIGRLGQVFNALITQLQIDQASIQQGATERARQLETVIDISQRLIGILDLSDLLRHVVSLTKERFNFYHVHIYLFDDQRSTLLMAEGSGEVGQELKRQGHSISVNALQSLVARCAREAQVVLAEDVRQYPDWLPNLLLPNTRAEMAVPIMSGSEVLGVMDVQSDKVSGISPAAGDILQTLAGQVAVAARNARLFSQTQEALYEARRLQRLYTGQAWSQFGPAGANTGFDHRQPGLPPLQEIDTPEVALAVQQQQTVNLVNPQPASNGECAGPAQDGCRQNALATPLKLRDEIIGVLGLHDANLTRRWTDDEVALIEAVSEQMSLAIENARLFERTQRDAWRNRVVGETTAGVWASNDMQAVLRAAVAQLADKLQATEVVIQLGAEPGFKQE
jgi:GAF domain-containing protein